MTVRQASWIQASSHPADTDRLVLESLFRRQGVVKSTDMAVTQNGTPNMSVNVAAGSVVIDGTESATQGFYHFMNDATLNVAIAASHATLPRIDLIVAKVQDAQYSGATNAGSIVAVTGTAAASPVAPSAPANSVILAQIAVAAAVTSITNANITDLRPFATQPPACRVYHNTTQSLTTAVETPLAFNTERYDTDNMHDTVTANGRITINTAGLYVVGLSVGYAANATGVRYTSIRTAAGTGYYFQDVRAAAPALGTNVCIGGVIKLAVGDILTAYAYQTSGGNLNVQLGTATDFSAADFWATWIGPA